MKAIKYLSCILLLISQFISAQNFWHQTYGPFGEAEVSDLCLTKSGILLAYVKWTGLYYTTDSGQSWTLTNYQAYDPMALETINDSIFIAIREHVYVSNDTGRTWLVTGSFNARSMYYESSSQLLYIGTTNEYPVPCGIYKSSDFGQSWELVHAFQLLAEGQWVHSLLVGKTKQIILASVIYSSPSDVYSNQYNQLYRFYKSTDFGQTWEIILEDPHYFVRQQIEDDSLNIFALAGTDGNKILVSEDEGETWIFKNNPQTECIATDHSGRLFRALSNKIWFSLNKGDTWTEVDDSGMSGYGICDIVINQNNRIYLATNKGVYYGEADSIVLSMEKFDPIKSFYLSQNYPNPFNPTTKIKFTIASNVKGETSNVSLVIYDILGNKIATLVNEEKQSNTYEVEFDGKQLQSGIYFYQLKAGNYIETKKMVLIK